MSQYFIRKRAAEKTKKKEKNYICGDVFPENQAIITYFFVVNVVVVSTRVAVDPMDIFLSFLIAKLIFMATSKWESISMESMNECMHGCILYHNDHPGFGIYGNRIRRSF